MDAPVLVFASPTRYMPGTAKDLGVKNEYERVLVSSRIPALMTSKVDLLIASMGMFPERAKVVQFSRPYVANVNMVVASRDGSPGRFACPDHRWM